jgi:hypothetical protein
MFLKIQPLQQLFAHRAFGQHGLVQGKHLQVGQDQILQKPTHKKKGEKGKLRSELFPS